MEAKSLASLNTLASNPPQYPERPFDEKQEPLVLYISRVPGTRGALPSLTAPQLPPRLPPRCPLPRLLSAKATAVAITR